MLFGRREECARIDAALDAAREHRAASLVVRGEAGIGKSALLEYAVERGPEFRVLRALGVESEAEFAFAGVQQLTRPILHELDELPDPQARALKTALAIEEGGQPEPIAVAVAILNLLAAAALEQPLLCVVDDAHWLDHGSAEALAFATRRMEAEEVVMLFAAREPEMASFSAPGLPELLLRGLPHDDARALLDEAASGLADHVADRLVGLTGGNPLALLEMSRALSVDHTSGRALLDDPLPVGLETQRAFLARVAALSVGARHALLLVAAGDPTDEDALWRALTAEGVGEAVAEAEAAGLLLSDRLTFCHPLARSAIYRGARAVDRRAAHAALGAAAKEPAHRAWHLAAATDQPDEHVAALLEETAAAAHRRGGVAAQAKALDRAARMTPDSEAGARRLFKSAVAAESAGWLAYAEERLRDAADLTTDESLRAQAIARRSYLLFDRADFDRAYAIAVDAADRAEPEGAAVLLGASGVVHVLQHKLDIPAARSMAERAWRLAGPEGVKSPDLCHMLAWTWATSGRTDEAISLVRSGIEHLDTTTVVAIDLGSDLLYLEDFARSREVFERVVGRMRDTYALGTLSYALSQFAKLELRTGHLLQAYAAELQSQQLAESLGNDVALADNLAWLGIMESMLGRDECRSHAEEALAIAERRGDRWNGVRARTALGLGALGRGASAEARGWLEPAASMLEHGGVENPNFFRVDADLIEAMARLGQIEEASRHLARFEAQAESARSAWGKAAAARCRALLSPEPDPSAAFERALAMNDRDPSAFERARTELCYGERLRRAGLRKRAREQLGAALERFEQIGADRWAERAAFELHSSGERLHPRDATTAEQLTPQELQIALLVAEGLSNRELGARLFLSVKTIEFHLTRIYRKLDIHSRSELVRRMVASGRS